jgi:hypothetical protein
MKRLLANFIDQPLLILFSTVDQDLEHLCIGVITEHKIDDLSLQEPILKNGLNIELNTDSLKSHAHC